MNIAEQIKATELVNTTVSDFHDGINKIPYYDLKYYNPEDIIDVENADTFGHMGFAAFTIDTQTKHIPNTPDVTERLIKQIIKNQYAIASNRRNTNNDADLVKDGKFVFDYTGSDKRKMSYKILNAASYIAATHRYGMATTVLVSSNLEECIVKSPGYIKNSPLYDKDFLLDGKSICKHLGIIGGMNVWSTPLIPENDVVVYRVANRDTETGLKLFLPTNCEDATLPYMLVETGNISGLNTMLLKMEITKEVAV